MLPIGPNGIPAFDTLLPSLFTKTAADSFLPYNYSLDLQGISNNVSCSYATDSPVSFGLPFAPITYVYQFNGTCPPGQDFLGTTAWSTIASGNTLGFWACETSTSGDAYNVYLRGIKNYNASIGNITCVIEPVQPAVYKLDYTGKSGVFNSTQTAVSTSPGTSTELTRRAIGALGNVRDLFHLYNSNLTFVFFQIVWQAQNQESNLVAESVFTFGIKDFNLPQYVPVDGYLRLYEAMIGGMIDYVVCYIAFLSTSFVHRFRHSGNIHTLTIFHKNNWAKPSTRVLLSYGGWYSGIPSVRLDCPCKNCCISDPGDTRQSVLPDHVGYWYVYSGQRRRSPPSF